MPYDEEGLKAHDKFCKKFYRCKQFLMYQLAEKLFEASHERLCGVPAHNGQPEIPPTVIGQQGDLEYDRAYKEWEDLNTLVEYLRNQFHDFTEDFYGEPRFTRRGGLERVLNRQKHIDSANKDRQKYLAKEHACGRLLNETY